MPGRYTDALIERVLCVSGTRYIYDAILHSSFMPCLTPGKMAHLATTAITAVHITGGDGDTSQLSSASESISSVLCTRYELIDAHITSYHIPQNKKPHGWAHTYSLHAAATATPCSQYAADDSSFLPIIIIYLV